MPQEKIRLQKIIADRGLASRRKAEEWIAAGEVSVNGETAQLGDKADPDTDRIIVRGKPLAAAQGNVYLMLHKPRGYITTMSDERDRKLRGRADSRCGTESLSGRPSGQGFRGPSFDDK